MRKQLTVHRLTENISACTHARADNAADEANTRRATAKNAFYDAHQPSKFVCENCGKSAAYTWLDRGFCSSHRDNAIKFKAKFPNVASLKAAGILKELVGL